MAGEIGMMGLRPGNRELSEQAREQAVELQRDGEALERLVGSKEWKVVVKYLEARGQTIMRSLLAPAEGHDGMAIALSAERSKGALAEIQLLPQWIATTLREYRKNKTEPSDDEVGRTAPPPESEGSAR